MELVIFGLIAVIALVGLVLLFKGGTGKATEQPLTRQVLPTEEEWRVERPGNYDCTCSIQCVYDGRTESAQSPITKTQAEAVEICKNTVVNRCAPQPTKNFRFECGQDRR